MDQTPSTLIIHTGDYAVVRLDPEQSRPAWLPSAGKGLTILARSARELSVTCLASFVPETVSAETGWRLVEVEGPLAFDLVGVLARLLSPLAEAGVPVLVTSTFDTDYILIKEADLATAQRVFRQSGHRVVSAGS